LGGARKKKGKTEKDNAETQRALRRAEVGAVARVRRADKIWRRKVGATNDGKRVHHRVHGGRRGGMSYSAVYF